MKYPGFHGSFDSLMNRRGLFPTRPVGPRLRTLLVVDSGAERSRHQRAPGNECDSVLPNIEAPGRRSRRGAVRSIDGSTTPTVGQ